MRRILPILSVPFLLMASSALGQNLTPLRRVAPLDPSQVLRLAGTIADLRLDTATFCAALEFAAQDPAVVREARARLLTEEPVDSLAPALRSYDFPANLTTYQKVVLAAGLHSLIDEHRLPRSLDSFSCPTVQNLTAGARTTRPSAGIYAEVLVRGDVRAVATSQDEESENTALTGGLTTALSSDWWGAVVTLNLISSQDTIRRNFGATMLSPTSAGAFQHGGIHGMFWLPFFPNWAPGLHTYLEASTSLWQLQRSAGAEGPTDGETPVPDTTEVRTALTTGLGLLIFKELAVGDLNAQRFRVGLEAGYAARILSGDITISPVLADVLGETDTRAELQPRSKWFHGLEFGLQIQYADITGAATYYIFYEEEDRRRALPGLSEGQLTVGFAVGGSIAEGWLSKPNQ